MNGLELKRFGLLEDFTDEEREALAEELEESQVARGLALFDEGDEADGLALLVEGEVRLESRGGGALGSFQPGAVLGALSLFGVGRREATALAASDCRVLWLDRSGFRRLVEDSPRAACKLQEALLRDLASVLREGLPLLVDASR